MNAKYAAGQRVEVLGPDFTPGAPVGAPWTWHPGTVDRVEPAGGKLVDVIVKLDGGAWSPQRVGPRGGNKRIRPA